MTGKKTEKEKYQREGADPAETEAAISNQSGKTLSLEAEIESLKQTLSEQTAAAQKNLEGWLRAEADFSNFRRRTEQEKQEMSNNTTCSVVYNILPVLDDYERALASIPQESANLPWVEGIQLIYKKLRSSLESLGLEEVCAMGQDFDPRLHEAVAHIEGEEGAVIDELQKGYKIKDKLIRPSRVIVGKGLAAKEKDNSGKNSD